MVPCLSPVDIYKLELQPVSGHLASHLTKVYKFELQDFLYRGALGELPKNELEAWTGLRKYISHLCVLKPGSTTTKLRVISNSILDKNNFGLSFNDCLPKGPNTLVTVILSIITLQCYQHCIVWDLSKA